MTVEDGDGDGGRGRKGGRREAARGRALHRRSSKLQQLERLVEQQPQQQQEGAEEKEEEEEEEEEEEQQRSGGLAAGGEANDDDHQRGEAVVDCGLWTLDMSARTADDMDIMDILVARHKQREHAQQTRCLCLLPALSFANAALKIASALSVIEWTPEQIAKESFYNGSVTIVNGGIPNLFSDTTVDLASNAETQALRNYASHKNLRIIYTISEVAYRIVADRNKVPAASYLKGKRIGCIQATSSGYFVEKYMESVGAKRGEYTTVGGNTCSQEPCGSGTFPAMLKAGHVDAVGFWEPGVELSARAIGSGNAVFYQDFAVYREIYSLHSTTEKLHDPAKRREIVSFVRALDKALLLFRDEPEKVYARAANAVNIQEELMRAVWPVHEWPGTIPADLPDLLAAEDVYVARVDNRSAMSAATLKGLIDKSIIDEVRGNGFE
ncbi:hypothetical protein BS50DRAFT_636109 [Corynespora cassiicola Philippines]|uniref:SsuA/THI5-like domain-containing protein n=1 Tax=Corynespora cassiicola Philippines TaxID=1448308 RepID=A0A2T2NIS2_CORCC|nr:hypothetical protein BS50DRAFT_636109 [Corynespora cassiicola Philippines]